MSQIWIPEFCTTHGRVQPCRECPRASDLEERFAAEFEAVTGRRPEVDDLGPEAAFDREQARGPASWGDFTQQYLNEPLLAGVDPASSAAPPITPESLQEAIEMVQQMAGPRSRAQSWEAIPAPDFGSITIEGPSAVDAARQDRVSFTARMVMGPAMVDRRFVERQGQHDDAVESLAYAERARQEVTRKRQDAELLAHAISMAEDLQHLPDRTEDETDRAYALRVMVQARRELRTWKRRTQEEALRWKKRAR